MVQNGNTIQNVLRSLRTEASNVQLLDLLELTRLLGPGFLVRRHFHLLAHNHFLIVANQTRVHGDVVFTRHQEMLWFREKVAVQRDSQVVAPSRKTLAEGYARMMSGNAQFRVVLTM